MTVRLRRYPALLAVAAIAAAGCVKGRADMTVERDGSATMVLEMALDPKLGSFFAEGDNDAEMSPEEIRDELRSDVEVDTSELPPGAEVEIDDVTIEGWPGIRASITNIDVEDMATIWTSAADTDDSADTADTDDTDDTDDMVGDPGGTGDDSSADQPENGAPVSSDYIGRDGDGWRVEIDPGGATGAGGIDSSGTVEGSEDAGDLGEGMDELAEAFTDMLLGDASFTWRVTMPGRVIEHEGGDVDGSTVTWKVALADPPERLFARWDGRDSPGGQSSPLPWIAGAVALAALIAAALWWRRRSPRPAPPDPV